MMRKFLAIALCTVALTSAANAQKLVQSPIFQGYTTIGTVFFGGDVEMRWGFDFNASFGARLNDITYIGVESGIACVDGYTNPGVLHTGNLTAAYVPIACNLRLFYPASPKTAPYFNLSVGGFIGVSGMEKNGFYLQAGAGIDVKRFTFGVGYTGLGNHGLFANAGYLKVGVKFGGKTW